MNLKLQKPTLIFPVHLKTRKKMDPKELDIQTGLTWITTKKSNGSHFSPYSTLRCTCGLSVAMPTAAESICYAELKKIQEKGRRGSTLHHNTSRVSVSLSWCLGAPNCILFLAAALRKRCSSGNCTTVSLNCYSFYCLLSVRINLLPVFFFANLSSIGTQHTGSWSGGAGAGWEKVRVHLPSCAVSK